MSLVKIITFPNPVLREAAAPIKNITDDVVRLSRDMAERMYLAHGAGLAANQVGFPVRLIVLDSQLKDENKPIIIINPVIIESDSEETAEEGCLSVPKYYDYVKRAKKVHVKGITLDEGIFDMECEGHLARVFQHEIDHLNGVLFIDHLSPVKKSIFKKKYLKKEK